jgi:hypothetical protein
MEGLYDQAVDALLGPPQRGEPDIQRPRLVPARIGRSLRQRSSHAGRREGPLAKLGTVLRPGAGQ